MFIPSMEDVSVLSSNWLPVYVRWLAPEPTYQRDSIISVGQYCSCMAERFSKSMSSAQTFGALFGLGLVGILALLFTIILLDPGYATQAEQLGLSVEVLAITTAIQSVVMLAVSVLVGLYVAPRLGFQSHLVTWAAEGTPVLSDIRSELRLALGGGITVAVILVVSNWVAPGSGSTQEMTVELLVRSLPVRLLYGGITEELLLRWGVMSLVAYALWRLSGQRRRDPRPAVVWVAIVVAAILFGVLHLPAAISVYGPLTLEIVGFIVGFNALGGIVFGWLFWQESLEAAMIAHALAHFLAVSFWIVTLFG